MNKLIIILIFDLIFYNYLIAQNNQKIDSIKVLVSKAKNDTNKIKQYIEIGDLFELSLPDSSIVFYKKAYELSKQINANAFEAKSLRYIGIITCDKGKYDEALEYYNKAIKIYEELSRSGNKIEQIEGKRGISNCLNNFGVVEINKGNYEKAIEYYTKAINISKEVSDDKSIANFFHNLGVIYYNKGSFDKSIESFMEALKILEKIGNVKGVADLKINIGIIQLGQKYYKKAAEYIESALPDYQKINDNRGTSMVYINLGNVYSQQSSEIKEKSEALILNQKSIEYFEKALILKKELEDLKGISYCYTNIGSAYEKNGYLSNNKTIATKNYDTAIRYFNDALSILETISDNNGTAYTLNNISSIYTIMFDSLSRTEYLDKAIEYAKKAYEISVKINANPSINLSSAKLQRAYTLKGNYKEALHYAEIYIQTQDSMYNRDKANAISDVEGKYQNEKKQLELDKQKETIARKDAENKKQRIIMFSFIFGFVIIIVFSIFLYRLLIQKRKANIKLEFQNIEISQQKEEIQAQRDEIEGQRDLVTRQKEQIEHIHIEMTDSIRYAKRIQNAVLPNIELTKNLLGEHFILFRPKDIVSGDFYWMTKRNEWLIFCVADCTGHGVPGGFMSMLGISFLNEIISRAEIQTANEVLNQLRKSVIHSMKQKGIMGEQKDGMDISLAVINSETNQLQWAGANNPLWIVSGLKFDVSGSDYQHLTSNIKHQTLNIELFELKPDKMPIAIYLRMDDFTNHELQLNSGDILYLMSDGFEDQFGGPKGKKFLSKNLKQLLFDNSQKPMNEQKEILEKTLIDWIGYGEQIDDITIIGIRI